MRISDWSSDVCSSDLRSEAIIQEANLQLEQKVKERTGEIIRKNLEIEDERKKQMASEYERKLAMAEMSTLRAQMNPHFMFNSLNTLEAFILDKQEKEASHLDRKSTRLNSSHSCATRLPSSACTKNQQ